MLNLSPIFQDAIDVLSQYSSHLSLPALPATVHLMQRDVLNHYRYAATHYLPLTLNEHFLQNSSIGTPYEKWAKFTNDDFNALAFTVTNLLRYTTRLIHETESVALHAEKPFREASARSNAYIGPLVEIDHRGHQIGIQVILDETLAITPFATGADDPNRILIRSKADGVTERWQITLDEKGNESRRSITLAECLELTRVLRTRVVSLDDRTVLEQIRAEALSECEDLEAANDEFQALCNSYCTQNEVATAFDQLHEDWWV
jgi:hypothetical protein